MTDLVAARRADLIGSLSSDRLIVDRKGGVGGGRETRTRIALKERSAEG